MWQGSCEEATVFVLADEFQLELGKANAKKLRVLRHPNVLKYLDSAESEKCVYIATERVVPLQQYLQSSFATGKKKELMLCWGIHQILVS
jgi:SCY1-like protein 1